MILLSQFKSNRMVPISTPTTGLNWLEKSKISLPKCVRANDLCRLGYWPGIYERKDVLQSLYDQLKDKSKILLNKKVGEIMSGPNKASVMCVDNSVYHGDIVIGAVSTSPC